MGSFFMHELHVYTLHIDNCFWVKGDHTVVAPIFLSTKTFEKRYENGSWTLFFETPLSVFKTSRRLANEIIAGIAV